MKKIISILILSLILSLTVLPVFAATDGYVDDMGDLLTDSEEASLNKLLTDYSAETGMVMAVVTVSNRGGKSMMEYADDYFDEHYYMKDGVVLVVDFVAGNVYISTGGAAIELISYDRQEKLLDILVEDIRYNLYENLTEYAERLKFYLQTPGDREPFTEDLGVRIIVCVVIGLFIALMKVNKWKKDLTSVQTKTEAADYVRDGSFALTNSEDVFLYKTVSRVEKPRDTSSRGGGGGSHFSSSGVSHGGGGRSF